jgi:hypothetical protein
MKIKRNLLNIALTIGFTIGGAGVASAAGVGVLEPVTGLGDTVAALGSVDGGTGVTHVRYRCRYARAHGFAGMCGWPYTDGHTIYFAEGNGWPFGCSTGNAGSWPYYYGVGVGGCPGRGRFGFAYSFRPYAICRQAHGPRYCHRHWREFQF